MQTLHLALAVFVAAAPATAGELPPVGDSGGIEIGSEAATWSVELRSGDLLRVEIDGLTEALLGEVSDPDGQALARRGALTTNPATLSVIAAVGGRHTVRLTRPAPSDDLLRLTVRTVAHRPATPRDRTWVEAEDLADHAAAAVRRSASPDPDRLREAVTAAGQAAELWRELGEPLQQARSLTVESNLHTLLSDHRRALERAEEAVELLEPLGDSADLAVALGQVGTSLLSLGAPDAAEPILRRCAELAGEAGLDGERHSALHNLGMVATERRRYQEALDLHRRALTVAQSADLADKAIGSRIALASVHSQLGDLAVAERWLREAIVGTRAMGEKGREGWAWRELGRVLAAAGRYDDALEAFRRSLEIRRETGNRRGAAVLLGDMANLERSRGRLEAALELHRQALDEARALGDIVGVGVTLGNIGLVQLELGHPAAAREALEEAVAVLPPSRSMRSRSSWQTTLARASLALGEPGRAAAEIEEAIVLDEQVRAGLADPELRARYLGQRHKLFAVLVEAHLRLAESDSERREVHLSDAFAASERSRSRSLLELLAPSDDSPARRRDARLESRGAEISAELSAVQRRLLDGGLDPSATAELERQRLVLEEARRRLDELRRASARVAQPPLVGLDDARARLPADTVLLEYLVSDLGSYVVSLDQQGVSVHRLADDDTLRAMVSALRQPVARPGRRDRQRLERAAAELGDALLGPVLPQLSSATQLVIAADGPLHLVPFDVLRVAAGDGGRVIDRWTVSMTPSASVLAALADRAATRPASRQLVAVAAPELPHTDAREVDPDAVVRGIVDGEGLAALPDLPYAAEEGHAVAAAFDGPAAVLVGRQATESGFKELPELARASHLHLATHALVSSTLPQHSSLVLARGDNDTDDGLLQAFEIADLDLAAELAVLSACATGTGDEVGGEGVLGLTQAVLEAGASAVVMSLWQVNDRSTRQLMETFYRRLGDLDPAAALRLAKLELAADPRFDHPFYWAAFAVSGVSREGGGTTHRTPSR